MHPYSHNIYPVRFEVFVSSSAARVQLRVWLTRMILFFSLGPPCLAVTTVLHESNFGCCAYVFFAYAPTAEIFMHAFCCMPRLICCSREAYFSFCRSETGHAGTATYVRTAPPSEAARGAASAHTAVMQARMPVRPGMDAKGVDGKHSVVCP